MDIFGLEKMSLVDFDGYVACTVFTGSCNFKCPFCHNASLVEDFKSLPTIPEQEIIDYLNKRKGIIEGICITGGEPTLNPDLPQFLEKIRKTGVKIKVDTNGTNPKMIKQIYENNLADYFAMDIKNSKENYAKIIGYDKYDTKNVEQSVEFLLSINNYEFRTTAINEFHTLSDIEAIGKWINGAKKYYIQKFKSGDNCLNAKGLSEVPLNTAKKFLEVISPFVPNAKLRGYDT